MDAAPSALWIALVAALASCTADVQPAGLLRMDSLAPGEQCPAGGQVVHTGFDADDSGALDDSEIETTTTLCNGVDGEAGQVLLTRVDVEAPGENCPGGGAAIHAGLDVDDDGVLDDEEITHTWYQCGDDAPSVIEGGLSVRNAVDYARLLGVTEVKGAVEMTWCPAEVYLPDLERADMLLFYCDYVDISLPALTEVTTDLTFEVTQGAESLRLPELTRAGTLWFFDFYGTVPPGFRGNLGDVLPKLQRVDSTLFIWGTPFTNSLQGLDTLATIGSLDLAYSPLTSLEGLGPVTSLDQLRCDSSALVDLNGLSSLEAVHDDITLGWSNLQDISALEGIAGDDLSVWVTGNPWLSQCHAQSVVDSMTGVTWSSVDGNFDDTPCGSR